MIEVYAEINDVFSKIRGRATKVFGYRIYAENVEALDSIVSESPRNLSIHPAEAKTHHEFPALLLDEKPCRIRSSNHLFSADFYRQEYKKRAIKSEKKALRLAIARVRAMQKDAADYERTICKTTKFNSKGRIK